MPVASVGDRSRQRGGGTKTDRPAARRNGNGSRSAVRRSRCGMVNERMRIRIPRGRIRSGIEENAMTPDQAKKLGKYLKKARSAKNLTSYQLGEMVGASNSTIVRLEQGVFPTPRPNTLDRIARALDLNLSDLYDMADYPVPNELPTMAPYLRTKYGELPSEATEAIAAYAERLAKKHGVDLRGPAPGEDELPEEPLARRKPSAAAKSTATRSTAKKATKKPTKKGGTK